MRVATLGGLILGWSLLLGAAPHSEIQQESPRIYLNGEEVTGLVDQSLTGVDVYISKQGDIHLTGEHYQVFRDTRYQPIQSVLEASPLPRHRPPQELAAPSKSSATEAEAATPTPPPPSSEVVAPASPMLQQAESPNPQP